MNLFKKEEKEPFRYTAIEMRQPKRNYAWWIVGIVFLVVLLIIIYLWKI